MMFTKTSLIHLYYEMHLIKSSANGEKHRTYKKHSQSTIHSFLRSTMMMMMIVMTIKRLHNAR
jgi:hypothetical protein